MHALPDVGGREGLDRKRAGVRKGRRAGRPGFSLTRRLRGTRADARKHHAHTQPAFHWGFIPLIIVLGMQTDPKPSLAQLLGPM